MKTLRFFLRLSMALVLLTLLLGTAPLQQAQEEAKSSLDVVVKISKVEETLNLIDELMPTDTGEPAMSPTAMLRGMIHGTDWIDPSRVTVLGVELVDGQPQAALLIPFQYPNEAFQAAYDASSGPDYYIMALPPGQGTVVPSAIEGALTALSASEAKGFLSVELAANELLTKGDQQIKLALDKIVDVPQSQGTPGVSPSPEELRQMLLKCLDVARQLELFTLGLDIDREEISYLVGVKALPETRLAAAFSQGGKTSLLDGYRPGHQINFRSRSFDIEGLMALFEDCFGKLYAGMGIDFSAMTPVFKSFTGEGAGGMSVGKDGMRMECMYVLKDPGGAPDFLENVYVPWIMKYSEDMAAIVEKNLGTKIESPFVRTGDSTVSGYKVIGIKTQFPVPYGPPFPTSSDISSLMAYESRMTTAGNLLIMAANDARMAELIQVAKSAEERPAEGPLIEGDIDVGGYLASLGDMVPGMAPMAQALPKLGKVTFVGDFENGEAHSKVSVKVDDIKGILAYFSKAVTTVASPAPGMEAEERAVAEHKETPEAPAEEVTPAAPPTENDPRFWLNKGALCSAYGNDAAAITYFEKAIELDPNNGDAYFQQGISYGELGRYEEGLSRVNKALELGPRKGLYLYGRGRIYLLAGEKVKAMDDFREAAALGQEDAQDYIQSAVQSSG